MSRVDLLVDKIERAMQILDNLPENTAAYRRAKDLTTEVLKLCAPQAYYKDVCDTCSSEEYGCYHRSGFRCRRCQASLASAENPATGDRASSPARPLAGVGDMQTVANFAGVAVSRNVSRESMADSWQTHLRHLTCSDPKLFYPTGFQFAKSCEETNLRLRSLFEGVAGEAKQCVGPDGRMAKFLVSWAPAPPAWADCEVAKKIIQRMRSLAHPNLLFAFTIVHDRKRGGIWFVHENLPFLGDSLAAGRKGSPTNRTFLRELSGVVQADSASSFVHDPAHDLGSRSESRKSFTRLTKASSSVILRSQAAQAGPAGNALLKLMDSDDMEEFKAIAVSVIGALKAIHERGFAHGDVRPLNIFYDERLKVTKLRFGPVPVHPNDAFSAPEVLADPTRAATMQSDMYALGVTLRLIFFGTTSAAEVDPVDPAEQAIHLLLCTMTDADPARRPSATEVAADGCFSVVRVVKGVPIPRAMCIIRTVAPDGTVFHDSDRLSTDVSFASSGNDSVSAAFLPDQVSPSDVQFVLKQHPLGGAGGAGEASAAYELASFISAGGPFFQVVHSGDALTLYSHLLDPRQKKERKRRESVAMIPKQFRPK